MTKNWPATELSPKIPRRFVITPVSDVAAGREKRSVRVYQENLIKVPSSSEILDGALEPPVHEYQFAGLAGERRSLAAIQGRGEEHEMLAVPSPSNTRDRGSYSPVIHARLRYPKAAEDTRG